MKSKTHKAAVTGFALLLPLALFTIRANAVDRGQYENVPDHIRKWFKSVQTPGGESCCDISDGHRTSYDVRNGKYWVPIDGAWWEVPDRAVIRNAGNPLGEAVVWYANLLGRIEITCFVPADAS